LGNSTETTLKKPASSGVTVIELLVVLSLITVLLSFGTPKLEDFAIRARIVEGLTIAHAAKQAMQTTCIANPKANINNLENAGFSFKPTKYVAEVVMAADCAEQQLWVGVILQNTGARSDPYLVYSVVPALGGQQFKWSCHLIRGANKHVPAECQEFSG
jgi:type IV pilus assembly protein PilA